MIVFAHVQKTAGTSFRFILENTFGVHHCHTTHTRKEIFEDSDLQFARRFFPGLRSIAGHNLIDPFRLTIPDAFYITFLREPIARVISHYQDNVLRGSKSSGFEEDLKRRSIYQNQTVKVLAGSNDLEKAKQALDRCHMVGLTEQFDVSLHLLKAVCPVEFDLYYRRRRIALGNQIKESIRKDPRLLELIREYNKEDLALYQYAVEEVFPRLCQKAGLKPGQPVSTFETSRRGRVSTYHLGRIYNKLFRIVCKCRKG